MRGNGRWRGIETFTEDIGRQNHDRLRSWAPIGDEIVDHQRYTITRTGTEFPHGRKEAK
ncbi:hypothetical protein [Natronorubrum halalkaliphilum]|uniref:hypothetical protein n=1 Tax=Natronorubrum halalkaliphilum TaxID=2691917 RepID=UPI001F2A48AE|nr:hypothetical protein [Natronorubrum halalkaliphilum]